MEYNNKIILKHIDFQLFSDGGENNEFDNDYLEDNENLEDDNIVDENDILEDDAEIVDQQRTSKQTPEQDAAFAQMRREIEARDKWVVENFGHHGIKTWDQYQQAVEDNLRIQQEEEQRQLMEAQRQREEDLAEQGFDVNAIKELIKNDPEFQQMRQENQQLKNYLDQQQFNQRIFSEFNELTKEYPEIKQIEDIDQSTLQRHQKSNGALTLLEAYELTNKAKIREKTAAAAKQKTLNNINSKSHLKTEGDGASEGIDLHIPSETLQMYLDQGMSKKQAMAHYRKLYG